MSYASSYPLAANAPASARVTFIQRTYGHLAGAILGFIALETMLLKGLPEGMDQTIIRAMFTGGWLIILLAFLAGGWIARVWAHSSRSPALQYLGLGLYVVLQAFVFLPLLFMAVHYTKDPNVIPTAGIMTLGIFGGLTVAVFVTGRDFSFLGPILSIGIFLALGVAVAGLLFGFNLGLFYSFAVVALASGYILYDTSNVLYHYRTDQHVGAALELFASVALLFFYILRILMASRD
jgi:FtsH-binding integral membrane protein